MREPDFQDMEDADMFKEDSGRETNEVRCRYCGERDLWWKAIRGQFNRKRWRLVTGEGVEHICPAKRAASVDEFEPVI